MGKKCFLYLQRSIKKVQRQRKIIGAHQAAGGIEQAGEADYERMMEQAVLAFRRAYELDADFAGLRYNMAVSLLALERVHDAIQWLQDHLSRTKDDADSRALLAKLNGLQSRKKAQGT